MVVKGDAPVNVTWQFNGRPIRETPGISISKMGNKASGLTIESVASIHRGVFTCFAQNAAGHTNHSTELAVNGIIHSKLTVTFYRNLLSFSLLS